MVALDPQVEKNCDLVIESLASIGYAGLIERRYTFSDYFSPRIPSRIATAAAFAQQPHSYDNACFAVLVASEKSGKSLISDFRSLGAPRAFEVKADRILHWRVGRTEATTELTETFAPSDVAAVFQKNLESWKPDEVLRLKNLAAPRPRQLDFIDIGLIPAIEVNVKQKLGPLLHRIVLAAQETYSKRHDTPINNGQLLRLVFRALAGKVLNDRDVLKLGTISPNADALLQKVDRHYSDQTTTIADKGIRQLVVDRMWDSISLKNISVEVLAYIWETAFVTDQSREDQGIHATPPSIARYITRRLPFEDFAPTDRRVVEPCCGSGTFLVAALNRLRDLRDPHENTRLRHHYLKSMLHGFDIDPFGLEVARSCLMLADFPNPNGWQLEQENVMDAKHSPHFQKAVRRASIVLCNPPFDEFSEEERSTLQPSSVFKHLQVFQNTLSMLSDDALVGFVMPSQFSSGTHYSTARRMLAEKFDDLEIVSLPDSAFAIAEQETSLIIAKSRRQSTRTKVTVLHRKVAEWTDWPAFNEQYLVTREDTDRLTVDQCAQTIGVPDLKQLWAFLRDNSRVADVATQVSRGVEWNIKLAENRDVLISADGGPEYRRGLPSAPKGVFNSFECPPVAFLNAKREYQRTPFVFELDWHLPKVVMNAKRRSRAAWRNSAFADYDGLLCYQSYTCLWTKSEWQPTVVAAILNGYVANAFVASHEDARDITRQTVEAIPVPSLNALQREEIDALVRQYKSTVETPAIGVARPSASELLDAIDAVILKAYRLPAELMTDLMEYFEDKAKYRAVSAEFHGPSPSLFKMMNKKARNLVREWSQEDSRYDDDVWPDLQRTIEENSLSMRKRFND